MKKSLLIAFGIVILLLIVGVWVYLFMFGAPKGAGEVFSNFGLNTKPSTNTEILPTEPSIIDTSPVTEEGVVQALKQLTTRPVAGAVFFSGGIRYMERGTGHVYDIMFTTGTETLVSGTTIPRVVDALFSTTTDRVIITSEVDGVELVSVGILGMNSDGVGVLNLTSLPMGAREVVFTDQNHVSYLETTAGGASGVSYDLALGTSAVKFSIPLRDVRVLWGNPTYIYTTPSATQLGYLYKINKGLEYVTEGGYGLQAIRYGGGVVVSRVVDSILTSTAIHSSSSYTLPISLFQEKCVPHPTLAHSLYCASPSSALEGVYPDNWYTGASVLQDHLWFVDIDNAASTELSDFLMSSGREVDVSQIGTNTEGTYVYFINKNDDTLWVFDTTLKTQGGV